MSENQNAEGSMPNIVPPLEGTRIDSAPNWETAYPMILWSMMTYYGDSEVIYNHHDSLVRYFDCLDSIYRKNGLKNFRTGYGDWGEFEHLVLPIWCERIKGFNIRKHPSCFSF